MLTLKTRDGTKIGNAIYYGSETREFEGKSYLIHLVETDFGNRCRFSTDEINYYFTLGKICTYQTWCKNRDQRRSYNNEQDEINRLGLQNMENI